MLSVVDDGDGFVPSMSRSHGMGLRTMNYRAGVIGGRLIVVPGEGQGTEVSCRLARKNSDPATIDNLPPWFLSANQFPE